MLILIDILKAVQIALYAALVCAIVFAILTILSYAKEELENNVAAMALLNQLKSTVEDLKKTTMIAEFQSLYGPKNPIEFFANMVMEWTEPVSNPHHTPRHTRTARQNAFESEFESFVRGFDRSGGLVEKRAPRHAAGLVGSPKYLLLR